MLAIRSFFYFILSLPIKLLVRCQIVSDDSINTGMVTEKQPVFYIVRHQSASDLLTLKQACKKLNLPDPSGSVMINGKEFARTFCLERPTPIFRWRKASKTNALCQGVELLKQHAIDSDLDAQLIPVNLVWGRKANVEKNNASVGTLLADQESPSAIRKFFIVLFLGRSSLARFSQALSLRYMTDHHGADISTAHKLLRVARFHFYRQTIAATGPRLMHRQQMFNALLANPAIKKLIADESKNKNVSKESVKKQALKIMDEIAGDYRESMVHYGERILNKLWKRLYKAIEVKNAQRLRDLAQEGHEIIYVPCHRSHMDYLLLTYIIYHEGLVTPRIAAGINLNFWPAGPIFRKAGAFFIRRSFRGNKLYSTIFREYLGLLFERGYSVKYYTEGGRSRTGRLLQPKTGMLAMTIQSLLRGIDRPLTLVPVYIGYEHVMEVSTYHKELSGSKKKNESILGVIKAIKNLRNYGKGFVSFGKPISINSFLNKQVPEWKESINPIEPQKPSWLTPSINVLSNQIMININRCAALNGVSLVALILLASENKALAEAELVEQLEFFIKIQQLSPYSDELTIPEESAVELVEHVKQLNKVTVEEDNFGKLISLSESAALEMSYYRNNIIHTYILPSLVCRIIERNSKIGHQDLITKAKDLALLIKSELFIWHEQEDFENAIEQILSSLASLSFIKQSKAGFWSASEETEVRAKLRLMADIVDETLQRLAIITTLVSREAPVSKSALEVQALAVAKRLSKLNNIHAPEFIDKKALSALINVLKEQSYISNNTEGYLVDGASLSILKNDISDLVDIEVLQTIAR